MRLPTRVLGALAILCVPAVPAARADDTVPVHHIRGTISAVTASDVTVSETNGSVVVPIDAKTKYVGVIPTTASEITSGTYIGATNVAGATSTATRALGIVVFPQSMAGTAEGDFAWDLPAGKRQESAMTNGTVVPHHAAMMTNATVTGVNNGTSKTVILQYKSGSKSLTIPPGTPIVRVVPGSKTLLVPGAHVFVSPGADGAAAKLIVVGEQGTVPPL